ncbi:hypothetical protein GCM10027418_07990 [Mariniluteicoccus endophyticus]
MTQQALPRDAADGRVRHYGHFYGLDAVVDDDRPLCVVLGNCQAEALRVLLDGAPSSPLRTVRIPPVFELTAADLTHLDALLERIDVLVTQPVRAGYAGLPLGTEEVVRRLRPGARVVRVPVCFYAGLYPWQVLVRTPESGDPPGVPYHDLRTVLEVATGTRPAAPASPDGIRAVAAASVAELARRERVAGTLVVSDLLAAAGADACHVVNHPGNTLLVGLARRVQAALGLVEDACAPERVLLSELFAPLYGEVVDALGLTAVPRPGWTHRGREVSDAEVSSVQREWLRAHPDIVDLALQRHATTARELGWL